MMQAIVKDSVKALEFYQKAFNAKILCAYYSEDRTFLEHAELDVYGQIFAITELLEQDATPGNTMMFCLHMGEGKEAEIQRIFEVLKGEATITFPLGACSYSPLNVALIDKFGITWCIFI